MSAVPSGERISSRRKWAAIGLATLLLAGAFWAVQFAVLSWIGDLPEDQEELTVPPLTTNEALGFSGGLVAMGGGFAALSLVSRRARPLAGAGVAWLLGSAVTFLLWFGLAAIAQFEPVTPLVGGFAAGGLVALRAEPEHTLGRRAISAAVITVYVFLMLRISPLIGVVVAPLLPLPVLAWADAMADRRAALQPVGRAKPALRRPGR